MSAPVAGAERIALLDVLRGFALYGVLLANLVPWFTGRYFFPRTEVMARMTWADHGAIYLISVLVDGKFQTLFSFLFGVGFAVQLGRAEARGASGVTTYLRRLAILFVIGACHVAFLWWGDVLWGYALTGVLLIVFRGRSTRALLLWAAALVLVPHLVSMIPAVADPIGKLVPHAHDRDAFKAQVLAALRGHDYGLLMRMQVEHAITFVAPIAFWYHFWVLGRFLIGYVAGRSRRLHDAADHLPFFRKLLVWGAGLGLPCAIAVTVLRVVRRSGTKIPLGVQIAAIAPEEIGAFSMAAAYVAAVVLLMQRPAWRARLMVLAPMGQMALSNYLAQSLMGAFLFYGWGLGLMGRVGPALCVPLSIVEFVVLLLISRTWMRRFRFGPVEWVWRSLTYGRRQPMLRTAGTA